MATTRSRPATPIKLPLAALAAILVAALVMPATAPAATRKRSALPAFSSCKSLVNYARINARRTAGRTGVPTRAGVFLPQVLDAPPAPQPAVAVTPGAPPPPPPSAAPGLNQAGDESSAKAAPDFSGTNVQEAGVDEPDIVKTDGKHVFAVDGSKIQALDVTGAKPALVGTLQVPGASSHTLLLRGGRLLVMSTSYGGVGFATDVVYSASKVVLTEVDVSNPAAMTIRRTMALDGAFVDARLTGGTARVVVNSSPGYIQPAQIASASVRRFVPRTTLRSAVTKRTFRRSVVACDDVRRPRQFSGLDLLTVLTIDVDKGLFDVDRDAILGSAQTVYGSTTGLYIASQRFDRALEAGTALPERPRTQIHRFEASKTGETSYASSGEIAGFVLNQYSLSEHDGALRVASTEEPPWFEGQVVGESESFVTVLSERGSTLQPLGRVGGLGKGERIYAVRFAGDNGYVVTFRQVDPLYTLDLSNKAEPKVLGELKIAGYSAYLHPISDKLLLGIGQDATAQGRTLGTQLSLFDVSDLRKPVRRAQTALGASSSQAEFDPHAFLYWNPTKLAVIPLESYGRTAGEGFAGAIGFRIGDASIDEVGRVTHPSTREGGFSPPIGRSLVIGDRLFTLSYGGLGASRVDNLAPLAFTAFPRPELPPPPPGPVTAPPPLP